MPTLRSTRHPNARRRRRFVCAVGATNRFCRHGRMSSTLHRRSARRSSLRVLLIGPFGCSVPLADSLCFSHAYSFVTPDACCVTWTSVPVGWGGHVTCWTMGVRGKRETRGKLDSHNRSVVGCMELIRIQRTALPIYRRNAHSYTGTNHVSFSGPSRSHHNIYY